jgi:hypothetical protein
MNMPTKTKVKELVVYPLKVGTLTDAERALEDKDANAFASLVGRVPFDELEKDVQDMKRTFWHTIYKDHKLDPQCAYHIDDETGDILQMGPNIPNAI